MSTPARFGSVLGVLVGVVAAQNALVTTNADSGAGSLRAAFTAANAAGPGPFVIAIAPGATVAPLVLASYLPSLTKADVTIQEQPGAARFVIDAGALTSAGGYGLDLAGAGAQITARLRLRIAAGNAIVVHPTGVRLADVEIVDLGIGSVGAGIVAVAGADGLVVGNLAVTGMSQGIRLQDCANARIGMDGAGVAQINGTTGVAITINNGSGHAIGAFVCSSCVMGISATNCPGLRIGQAGAPRSSVASSIQQGVLLTQCSDAAVTDLDLLGNGTGPTGGPGLQLVGGTGQRISDVFADANSYGGVTVDGGVTNLRIGPAVTTHGFGGAQDTGLALRSVSGVTVSGCVFGPGHRFGVTLQPGTAGMPTNVTIHGGTVTGNVEYGVSVLQSDRTLVCNSTLETNFGRGLSAVGASLATGPHGLTVAGCTIRANAESGILGSQVDTMQIGPGNRIDDNFYCGVQMFQSPNVAILDALSIAGNRSQAIWLQGCANSVVARSSLRDSRIAAVYALQCSGLHIGPSVSIRDTVGVGVLFEGCNGSVVDGSSVLGSTIYGFESTDAFGTPATTPNRVRSTLISGAGSIGVFHLGGPPLALELSTVAGNLRGVYSANHPLTIDSCIVRNNLIEDLQPTATATTVTHSFHAVPAPAAGSTNSNVDPLFVAPATGDWRLQAGSPAIAAANPAQVAAPGDLDAFDGPRAVAAIDAGAYEVGPHTAANAARLLLSSATMAHGGGGLAFDIRYPAGTAGMLSLVLCEIGLPSGSFPAFGATIPLGLNPALLLITQDPNSPGGVALIGAEGVVQGALLWSGVLPGTLANQPISLCAVAMDFTPAIHAVSNVATFTVQ